MNLFYSLKKKFLQSRQMDKKRTYSTRLNVSISLSCNTILLFAALVAFCLFFIDNNLGILIYSLTIYISPLLLFIGLFFAIKERVRGNYLSANISIFLAIFSLLILIILIFFK